MVLFSFMELRKYYQSLTVQQRKEYAERAGTDVEYIRVHLIPPNKQPDRTPRRKLMQKLAEASDGNVTIDEVFRHFFDVAQISKKYREGNAA